MTPRVVWPAVFVAGAVVGAVVAWADWRRQKTGPVAGQLRLLGAVEAPPPAGNVVRLNGERGRR